MRYLVTGATGFIGRHVVSQLLAEGHEVRALVREPLEAIWLASQGVDLFRGDITDRDSVVAAMTRDLDGVFHLAAWYKLGNRDSSHAMCINVVGTGHVLQAAESAGVPRVVYTSTLAANSDTHGEVVDERYHYRGRHLSVYDRTKWEAHYEVAQVLRNEGYPIIIVKPGVTYGIGDTSAMHTTLQSFLRGKLPGIPEGLGFTVGHVEDTARGHLLAMAGGVPGEDYIIAGHPITMVDLLAIVSKISGVPVPTRTISPTLMRAIAVLMTPLAAIGLVEGDLHPETLRETAGTTYWGSNLKAVTELGLEHRPLEEGLRPVIEWEMSQLPPP